MKWKSRKELRTNTKMKGRECRGKEVKGGGEGRLQFMGGVREGGVYGGSRGKGNGVDGCWRRKWKLSSSAPGLRHHGISLDLLRTPAPVSDKLCAVLAPGGDLGANECFGVMSPEAFVSRRGNNPAIYHVKATLQPRRLHGQPRPPPQGKKLHAP